MSHLMSMEVLSELLGESVAVVWYEPLHEATERFEIDTVIRVSTFLAQCSHESQGFTRFEENLNYSADGLRRTFKTRVTSDALAARLAHRPSAIANFVYGGRYGNGPEETGDGWKYRGRGPKQITFRDNYRACGKHLGLDLEEDPQQLLIPRYGALAAGWYWWSRDCNSYADAGDFEGLTKQINGGLNGLDQRLEWWVKVRDAQRSMA